MPRKCSICTHPDRGEIEAAILNGTSFRNITKRYGMSIGAISRHQNDHMNNAIAEVAKETRRMSAESLLDQIQSAFDRIEAITRRAEKAQQDDRALRGLREIITASKDLLVLLKKENFEERKPLVIEWVEI